MDENAQPAQWAGDLSEREQEEIMFARVYAASFHHGTDGHSRLMLLAKLADKLDAQERQFKAMNLLTPAAEIPKDAPMPTQWNLRKPQGMA